MEGVETIVNEVNETVSTINDNINMLTGDETVEGSVDYKIADLKFLDVSLKVADEYKAKNFENTIIQVREEIDKLKQ